MRTLRVSALVLGVILLAQPGLAFVINGGLTTSLTSTDSSGGAVPDSTLTPSFGIAFVMDGGDHAITLHQPLYDLFGITADTTAPHMHTGVGPFGTRLTNTTIECAVAVCSPFTISFNTLLLDVTGLGLTETVASAIDGTAILSGPTTLVASITVVATRNGALQGSASGADVFVLGAGTPSFSSTLIDDVALDLGGVGFLNIEISGSVTGTLAQGDSITLPSSFTASISAIPEPSTVLLLMAGLAGFLTYQRRRR